MSKDDKKKPDLEEMCFGFWSQGKKENNGQRICRGISIVEVKSEAEIEEIEFTPVTGIRIVIVSDKEGKEGKVERKQAPDQHVNAAASEISTPQASTIGNVLKKRAESMRDLASNVSEQMTNKESREKLKEAIVEMGQQQYAFSKKVFDKMCSLDHVKSTAEFTQRALQKRVDEWKSWVFGSNNDDNKKK
eukprot:Nk52_evm19s293 gene=Nk52_evmTU19s293